MMNQKTEALQDQLTQNTKEGEAVLETPLQQKTNLVENKDSMILREPSTLLKRVSLTVGQLMTA
ncbi:hypothetical protein [Marinomonas sp. GJ51-6]|uniref:hypothetical protein n=1 Tax=Marinomonas sp. GJ51-6 TaxID=2992802 RepID=UPI0029346E64|nr:hypothetical protein [Marinomonas sp. GJ51-6]WOD06196.1 hypothetical protein ONZ50_10655 [Marinomonas sp. GJ51-6]